VILGRLEAVDILEKWREEKTPLRCQGSFSAHAFAIEGIIDTAAENEFRLIAGTNMLTQVVVKLTDALIFNYADHREITGKEAKYYPSCLTIAFPPIPEEGPANTIAFAEISEDRPY
jgi:hypothetical protein